MTKDALRLTKDALPLTKDAPPLIRGALLNEQRYFAPPQEMFFKNKSEPLPKGRLWLAKGRLWSNERSRCPTPSQMPAQSTNLIKVMWGSPVR